MSLSSEFIFQRDDALVYPGQCITKDMTFMRGHGTFMDDGKLLASVAGKVDIINKLISVKAFKTRYVGEIGDVVVGRVIEVDQKKWKVDINGHQHAMLQLSAIHLPDGTQRRKVEEDELQIRTFFIEGEILSAEIQAIHHDGTLSIHTRSLKYGKLENGIFISVRLSNVRRSKSHFHRLPCGVDMIIGLNGYIWIGRQSISFQECNSQESSLSNTVSFSERQMIVRVRNCIVIMDEHSTSIDPISVHAAYEASLSYPLVDIMLPNISKQICETVMLRLGMLLKS